MDDLIKNQLKTELEEIKKENDLAKFENLNLEISLSKDEELKQHFINEIGILSYEVIQAKNYELGILLSEKLIEAHPDDPRLHSNLALCLENYAFEKSDLEERHYLFDRAYLHMNLAIRSKKLRYHMMENFGTICMNYARNLIKIYECLKESVEVLRTLSIPSNNEDRILNFLSRNPILSNYQNLSGLLTRIDEIFEKAIGELQEATKHVFPGEMLYHFLGRLHSHYADIKSEIGDDNAAIRLYNDSIYYYRQALKILSNESDIYTGWANSLRDLARLKKYPKDILKDCIEKYRKAYHLKPDYTTTLSNLGGGLFAFSEAMTIQKAILEDDEELFKESTEIFKMIYENDPEKPQNIMQLATSLSYYAYVQTGAKQIDLYLEAIEKFNEYVNNTEPSFNGLYIYGQCLNHFSKILPREESVNLLEEAVFFLSKAVEINSYDHPALTLLAESLLFLAEKKGKDEGKILLNQAIKLYEQAISLKDDDYTSTTNSGLAYLELAVKYEDQESYSIFYNRAIEKIMQATKLRPGDPEIIRILGKAYFDITDKVEFHKLKDLYDVAIEQFQNALDLKYDPITVYFLSTALRAKAGLLSNNESISLLKESIRVAKFSFENNPEKVNVLRTWGFSVQDLSVINKETQDLELIIKNGKEYLTKDPNDIKILNLVGTSFLTLSQIKEDEKKLFTEEALKYFNRALVIEEITETVMNIGLTFMEQWKIPENQSLNDVLERAIAEFKKVENVDIAASSYNLANAYSLLGDIVQGLNYLEKSFQNNLKLSRAKILKDNELKNLMQNKEFFALLDKYRPVNEYELQIYEMKKPLVITEGKTDWRHIKKALNKLQEAGEFLNLDINFLEFDIEMGDSNLDSLCSKYALTRHEKKIICLFDRDNPVYMKKHIDPAGKNFCYWKNNVYSFCIPKPSHRQAYNNISIEFYYTDNEIMTPEKESGRRLHFNNELSESIIKIGGQVKVKKIEKLITPDLDIEYDKKIFDELVEKIEDDKGNKIAISKGRFAENIYNDIEGFDKFDFSKFRPLLSSIEEIIKDAG